MMMILNLRYYLCALDMAMENKVYVRNFHEETRGLARSGAVVVCHSAVDLKGEIDGVSW
jgi:hypothetical protein